MCVIIFCSSIVVILSCGFFVLYCVARFVLISMIFWGVMGLEIRYFVPFLMMLWMLLLYVSSVMSPVITWPSFFEVCDVILSQRHVLLWGESKSCLMTLL